MRIGEAWGSFLLSPRYTLTLAERSYHRSIAHVDGSRLALVPENIEYYNSMQLAQAYRQVFSTAQDFELASRMRQEHPHLFVLDRPRVTTHGPADARRTAGGELSQAEL